MSYILDALKKAEKERKGNVGDNSALGPQSRREKKKRFRWLFFLIGALLINAGIMLWWLGPLQSVFSPETSKERGSDLPIPPVSEDESRPSGSLPHDRTPAKMNAATDTLHSSPPSSAVGKEKPSQPLSSPAQEPASDKIIASSGIDKGFAASNGGRLFHVSELPASIRQEIPDLSISLLYYTAEPSSRLITVNSRNYREGEEITSGLKVDSITSDGAVFSYQNVRFHVRIDLK